MLVNKQEAVLEKTDESIQPDEKSSPRISRKLLSRGEAAVQLGLSISEFRRREKLGIYVPTLVDDRGWHFFSLDYLKTLPGYGGKKLHRPGRRTAEESVQLILIENARQQQQQEPLPAASLPALPGSAQITQFNKGAYDPATAAKVFRELSQGATSVEIVMRLEIHPEAVANIFLAWKKLQTMNGGGIQVSAKTLQAMSELPLPGTYPVQNEEQLLQNLREISHPTCMSCKEETQQICLMCAEKLYHVETPKAPPRQVGVGRGKYLRKSTTT